MNETKRQRAILALLSQRSVEEAARVAGVGTRTLFRWLKDPEFDAAYREAKRQNYSQSVARLQQLTGAAVATLGRALLDPNTPPATKVRAATGILNSAARAIEDEDFEERLARLERTAQAVKPTSKA